jgi:ADP-ribosyl-[dinitrogen reductase] hydrolase
LTIRTSTSHPLQIAVVQAHPGHGRIGITFCPGKKQPNALTGRWDRDLCTDIEAIRSWGAAAVVTLIEDHEIASLNVQQLGNEVCRNHMDWHHLPIVDVSVPCSRFEQEWVSIGASLRARLRDRFDVLVHCKGGLGRAGTVAARLLIELGMEPGRAVETVRAARPGAIETPSQVRYVLRLQKADEPCPSRSMEDVQDRAVGALLGLAVGDAVGTTLEFKPRDSYQPLQDMIGGGPFHLKRGQWTDDTSMALALADSLLEHPELDEADLMERFSAWQSRGDYSCTGRCFDIGMTVSQALQRYRTSQEPIAGSTDPMSAGNGSLMRLAPVAVRFWNEPEQLSSIAARQSATTHGAAEAVSACVTFAGLLSEAIAGEPRSEVMRRRDERLAGKIRSIMGGSWRGKSRDEVSSTGYVAHSLEAALWSVGRTGDFRSAVLTAANLGEDADTSAAIAGQLAGALYGASGIPAEWLDKLAWQEKIRSVAERLFEASIRR